MELLKFKKIELKKTVRKLNEPIEFDLEMSCREEIPEGVVFTVVYNVNVKSDHEDQILSETELAPIPKGNVKFTLEADAPDINNIPHEQIFGLTSIIIIGKYKDQQFMRIGYIVDIYYPNIPNEKLINYEELDDEEMDDEGFEGEELEDDENEDLKDLVVSDEETEESRSLKNSALSEDKTESNEGENKSIKDSALSEDKTESNEEEVGNPKDSVISADEAEGYDDKMNVDGKKKLNTFGEALEERIQDNKGKNLNEEAKQEEEEEHVHEDSILEVQKELNKDIKEELKYSEEECKEGVFEYKGYKIKKNEIEMNVMVPPSIHTFLINWKDEVEVTGAEEDESHKKRLKTE